MRIDSAPAGCSSAKVVKSYTMPCRATQQLDTVACAASSSALTSRRELADGAAVAAAAAGVAAVADPAAFRATAARAAAAPAAPLPPRR